MSTTLTEPVVEDGLLQPATEQDVRNAALVLDEHFPGWAQRIDLQELELHSCWKCVLGQLYPELGTGTEPPYFNAIRKYNFLRSRSMTFMPDDWNRNQAVWEDEIRARI